MYPSGCCLLRAFCRPFPQYVACKLCSHWLADTYILILLGDCCCRMELQSPGRRAFGRGQLMSLAAHGLGVRPRRRATVHQYVHLPIDLSPLQSNICSLLIMSNYVQVLRITRCWDHRWAWQLRRLPALGWDHHLSTCRSAHIITTSNRRRLRTREIKHKQMKAQHVVCAFSCTPDNV